MPARASGSGSSTATSPLPRDERADRLAHADGRRRRRDHARDALGGDQHLPRHERPKAIALWSAAAGIGVAIGPITGGTLGIAVLGSLLTSAYPGAIDSADSGLSGDAAAAAGDSLGAADELAAGIGGDTGTQLVTAANDAFVDAMSTTASIAAAIAIAGALIAAAFLPARARREAALIPEPAAA